MINSQNLIVQKTILSLLPNEIILNKRALKIKYKILNNKKVMMILTNISAQKKLERKAKKEHNTLKMIVTVVQDSEVFYDLKKDFEYFVKNKNQYINNNKTSIQNINTIYRTIHTYKGTFLQLGMNNSAKKLHLVESRLSEFLSDDTNISNNEILRFLNSIDFDQFMKNDLDDINQLLGDKFLQHDNFVSIDKQVIKNIEYQYRSLLKKNNINNIESNSLLDDICYISQISLKSLLNSYPRVTKQTAQKLEKMIYEFEIVGDDNILVSDKYKPFTKSLIHLFRNSVDHGIETPEQRAAQNKDETGSITCSFNLNDTHLQIIIADDGAGINVSKIREKLDDSIDLNNLNDEDIYLFIFKDNMSTKDEITDISGRGVGMSAVKAELEKLNGTVKIQSELNVGTSFTFDLELL
jgi:two-component system chemotaxis sensor kinase CheA